MTLMEQFIAERLKTFSAIGRGRKTRIAALYSAVTNYSLETIAAIADTTEKQHCCRTYEKKLQK